MMFFGLGVRANKRDETYLTTFLSFWLCAFVLPNKEGEFVRPGTFKMASLMASGRKISLAIPVLAIIYNVYSGEGGERYFESNDARKYIHGGENVAWTSTMLDKTYPYFYKDNNHAPELKLSYFMSIRFNYLPLQCRDSFIIEPYSPHHFSHQFGFYQNIPSIMKNDIRSASLDKGLMFWRI
ncbi:hypothetical protein KY284_035802 [Solanum tuberosum]|nr:hypothetical protein KY284_035802 [Solanum tuberosum]